MDKNYYEILEVDRNASPEIIEKAYKTLAKKYHPDLQDEIHKKEAEETFKIINEAYQTLSNPTLKIAYDKQLATTTISQENYNAMYKQNQVLKNELNHLHHLQQKNTSQTNNKQHIHQSNAYIHQNQNPDINFQKKQAEQYQKDLDYDRQVQQAKQQAYYDAYIQDLKNRGYKIKYKKTFKDYLKNFIAFIIAIFILFIIWNIPFVQNYFKELYNTNFAFSYIIDLFNNLFK